MAGASAARELARNMPAPMRAAEPNSEADRIWRRSWRPILALSMSLPSQVRCTRYITGKISCGTLPRHGGEMCSDGEPVIRHVLGSALRARRGGEERKRALIFPLISWFEGAPRAFHNGSDSGGAGGRPVGRQRVVRKRGPRAGEEARSAQKTLTAEGPAKREA